MKPRVKYEEKYASFRHINCYKNEIEFFGYQFDRLLQYIDFNKLQLSTCLDIGCGFGLKTYYLTNKFRKVVGADFVENIIRVNELLNDCKDLKFITYDFYSTVQFIEKFDCVTAFGFSILNVKDQSEYINKVEKLLANTNEKGMLIIWSFSDFSGNEPTGWYNHTKDEINQLISKLDSKYSQVRIFYPYNKVVCKSIFTTLGLKNFLRFFQSKKYYFLIINK
ncbi:MAG: class I SAM-dependent methyltransferase [Saprospiraceae bacterium]|nr:class I SAM-dependent methyltransferase [Saprospiraceae bacterium]